MSRHGADNNARLASALVVDVWTNWGRNQQCAAEAVDHPGDEAELVASIKAAAAAGHLVAVHAEDEAIVAQGTDQLHTMNRRDRAAQ